MSNDFDIAVVGVGCRFPDAWTARQYWSNIAGGLVSMRRLSDDQLRAGGVPDAAVRAPDYVRVGTTLPGVADFAARFFGCTPREARAMDPQQRIFLETCWEALEFAGHPPDSGGPQIGVFAGSAAGNYSAALMARAVGRLGLRGPAVSVQTACSSSLYAVHYASLSLLSGECDIALAGGANVLEPLRGYRYVPGRGQSEDGYCRSFDARATGTAYSSGVAVVALRRLADAQADGDPVLAVLRGSAVGNDGAHKAGWAAPSPAGVAGVVRAALRVAGVPADLLRYVEAHGTATPIGDHIELAALTDALRIGTAQTGYCGLGSVKANIGHTGPTSGIAGFINAVQVARTGTLPPHPMFSQPRDPDLLAGSPFRISTAARECTDPDRHVLVNAIGFGGANAAAVLAAPPEPTRPAAAEPDRVRLVLSARTRLELDQMSRNLADALDRDRPAAGDVSHTLRVGRAGHTERRVVTAPADRLAAALRLPRPPAVQSLRSEPRRAAILCGGDADLPAGLLDRLLAALPDRTEVLREPAGDPPAGRFRIVLGPGESGPDQHVLTPVGEPSTDADRVDAALAAAWLHGVPVDWQSVAGGVGRRVVLPTYPFARERHWGLDGVSLAGLLDGGADGQHRANGQHHADGRPSGGAGGGDDVDRQVLEVWRDVTGADAG